MTQLTIPGPPERRQQPKPTLKPPPDRRPIAAPPSLRLGSKTGAASNATAFSPGSSTPSLPANVMPESQSPEPAPVQLDLLSWQPEPALMQEPSLPLPPNRHVLGWHYAGLHYYRRMINHLHRLSQACSTKIKQLGGI